MTLAGRDSGDLSMTFRDLKSFGARLSDLSRTLAGDPKMRVSDLKLSTLNVQLPVLSSSRLAVQLMSMLFKCLQIQLNKCASQSTG